MGSSSLSLSTSTFTSFSLGSLSISIDWILFSVLVALFALESFRSGSARAATFAISLPLSLIALQWLSSSFIVGNILHEYVKNSPLQLGVFAILFALFFFLTYRIVGSPGGGNGGVLPAVISGFSATVVLMAVWPLIPGLAGYWQFADSLSLLFGESYRAWWLIGSYVALAFARS